MTVDELRAALAAGPGQEWLADALRRVAAEPAAIAGIFPQAGRRCGRAPLPAAPGWTADEAARAQLLAALPAGAAATEVAALYRYGDAAEKRAVLKALPLLDVGGADDAEAYGDAGVPLLHDAIRTNDTRLVAAALGPYARRLDDAAWRQAVLKCVFMGVPLAEVHGLDDRADGELAVMLAGLSAERAAAGRALAADAADLLARLGTTREA